LILSHVNYQEKIGLEVPTHIQKMCENTIMNGFLMFKEIGNFIFLLLCRRHTVIFQLEN
jgi:hypothetical protein